VLNLEETEGMMLGLLTAQTLHIWLDGSPQYCTVFLKCTVFTNFRPNRYLIILTEVNSTEQF
jgi:hypothetical protein